MLLERTTGRIFSDQMPMLYRIRLDLLQEERKPLSPTTEFVEVLRARSGLGCVTAGLVVGRHNRTRASQSAFASASSARILLVSDPGNDGLAPGADDADGADGIFGACAHPDHSGPHPAFARERDLGAQRPQERLRPPQSTGERPRISCLCATRRDVIASTLRIQTQKR
jgi:hypothetical protein